MEAKEILAKLKQAFNDLVAPAATAPAPAAAADAPKEYEIAGGGKCMIDKLEAGGIVLIDGAPALPGDLELADGTKLTVGDNGVISAITPATPAAPDAPAPDDMSAKFSALETMATEKFAAYETKFSAYEQRFADYEVKLGKANKVIEQLLQLSTVLVEKPAAPADPAASRQNNGFKEKELDYDPALFSEKLN